MRLRSFFLALAVVSALAACSTAAPILNVSETPVTTASGKAITKEQVRSAILRAGSGLGWQLKDDGPNLLVGTLQLRTHTAVISIPYTATSYSIKYRSSLNLNEKDGTIHKNYNSWIQNLDRAITAQLLAAS